MKITDFIEGKVTYDKVGQYFWVNNANEGLQMLAELRGWGRIQNMFKSKGKYDLEGAEKFQDELGEWVASAINEKLQRESEQILLNKPAVIGSLPSDKIFKLLESDKYGWNRIRETGSAVQMEMYRDIMRATAEVIKGNDL